MGWVLIALVAALYVAVGPWGLVAVAALLCVPRVRARVPRPRFSRRTVAVAAGATALVAATVVVLPDGALTVPTAGGLLVMPDYTGRQVAAQELEGDEPPQHPWQADFALYRPGPLGDASQARAGWYGLEGCRRINLESHDRLVAMCSDPSGPVLRVIDPDTLRTLASKRLPDPKETDDAARAQACDGTNSYLDNGDRAVVTTTDARILAIGTSDANGDPDLTVDQTWNLNRLIDAEDCLVGATPDWSGRIWWASYGGRVGVIDPVAGGAEVFDLDEKVTRSFAVDDQGVYLTTDHAVYRLSADAAGVDVVWRHGYDRGVEVKSGQVVRGSGSGATLVEGDLLAFADNAEPRMRVVFVDRSTGEEVCRAGVFDGGESATSTSLVSVGSGVVAVNDHGAESTASTFWGLSTTGGLARVDQANGVCTVAWTNEESAPSVRPVVSWQTGLLYTWGKRGTLWGVPAYYLSAIDVRTGRTMFSVRGGTGRGLEAKRSHVTLNEAGEAFVGVVGGVVRVRDQVRD